MVQNIVSIVVAVVVVGLGYVAGVAIKDTAGNSKANTLLSILETLAKDAVIAARKLGVDKQLSGLQQKSEAVQRVLDKLDSLGFTKADLKLVYDAVEHAYADLKDQLATIYPPKKVVDKPKEETMADLAKQQSETAAKMAALAAKDKEPQGPVIQPAEVAK